MPQGTGMKCVICFYVLKFLYERIHTPKISEITGEEYRMLTYKKKALYCKYCDVVYPLDLKQKAEDLTNLI